MARYKNYNTNGPSAEDRALDRFAEMMIEKIESMQDNWKKPWFTEGSLVWPKNLSGREYNGMNALMLMMHAEKEGYKIPVYMTFERVSSLNFTTDKQGGKKPAVDKEGHELPHVGINKGEKSFPVFITTFTVVDKETKEKASPFNSGFLRIFCSASFAYSSGRDSFMLLWSTLKTLYTLSFG